MAAAQYQRAPVEEAALRIIAQIERHGVETALIVYLLQTVVRNGDELALVVGGARRLGIPFNLSRPQHVVLAVAHTVDISLQFLVTVQGNGLGKVVIRLHGGEQMFPPVFGMFALRHQTLQHLALHGFPLALMPFQFLLPLQEYIPDNSCNTHFRKNQFECKGTDYLSDTIIFSFF